MIIIDYYNNRGTSNQQGRLKMLTVEALESEIIVGDQSLFQLLSCMLVKSS